MRAWYSTSLIGGMVLLAGGLGCSEPSDPKPVTLDALEGHWKASSLTYRDLADASQSLEMVQTGQQTIDLTIDGSTYARFDTFPTPRFAISIDSGTVALAGEMLSFESRFGDSLAMRAAFDGSRLVLTDTLTLRLFCSGGCPVSVRYRFRRD